LLTKFVGGKVWKEFVSVCSVSSSLLRIEKIEIDGSTDNQKQIEGNPILHTIDWQPTNLLEILARSLLALFILLAAAANFDILQKKDVIISIKTRLPL
jgi:hypothetical protein